MDQAHDIAYYFDRGLRTGTGGKVSWIVEPHRDLAAISGWAKDQPFTAIIFVGFPHEVDTSEVAALVESLSEVAYTNPSVNWDHPGVEPDERTVDQSAKPTHQLMPDGSLKPL